MRFCFWGDVDGALSGRTTGGAELQVSLLAKALARAGHQVVIINYGTKNSYTTPEGIEVNAVENWWKGPRFIRFFLYRAPGLRNAFLKSDADYYYVRSRSVFHLFPYMAARKKHQKFLLAFAHDLDAMSITSRFRNEYLTKVSLLNILTFYIWNDLVFNYLVRKANLVLLQHAGQKKLLNGRIGHSAIFPNIIELPAESFVEQKRHERQFVHAGSLTVLKGSRNLQLLLEKLNGSDEIVIIGEAKDKESARIVEELKSKSNVRITGRLSHTDTKAIISNSTALISTSNFEGFPNIFLEAWASGVPVISLSVNPGDVITDHSLGVFCDGDIDKMKAVIESFDPRQFPPESLRAYVKKNHDFEGAADRFLQLLNK